MFVFRVNLVRKEDWDPLDQGYFCLVNCASHVLPLCKLFCPLSIICSMLGSSVQCKREADGAGLNKSPYSYWAGSVQGTAINAVKSFLAFFSVNDRGTGYLQSLEDLTVFFQRGKQVWFQLGRSYSASCFHELPGSSRTWSVFLLASSDQISGIYMLTSNKVSRTKS